MSILGNIFIAVASLIFIALFYAIYIHKSPRNGDAVIGYVWGIIYYNLAFFVCMAISFISIGWIGGFEWIGSGGVSRFFLVLFGLLVSVIATGLSGLMKNESKYFSKPERVILYIAPALIPFLMISASVILLNESIRNEVSPELFKISLLVAFGMSLLIIALGILSIVKEYSRNAVRRMERELDDSQRIHLQHLEQIETCDVFKNMVFILVYTDMNHEPDVRERAVTKIKSNPNWQQELIRLLECDWSAQVFTFLASNEVDDKNIFLHPVYTAVLNQAKLIRENIRRVSHPSHLYPDLFSWEITRMLLTIDKFMGMGVDFLPAVNEVLSALDEPVNFTKPKFICIAALNNWINENQ